MKWEADKPKSVLFTHHCILIHKLQGFIHHVFRVYENGCALVQFGRHNIEDIAAAQIKDKLYFITVSLYPNIRIFLQNE